MRATRQLPDYEILDLGEERLILLAGEPDSLVGEIPFSNPGDETIVIKEVVLRGLPEVLCRGEVNEVRVPIGAILRPGECARVPVHLSAPSTPPGRYEAEMKIGEQTVGVAIEVSDVIDLEIIPDWIQLPAGSAEPVSKRIVFFNRGNVPLEIGPFGAVPLEDEHLVCRSIRGALREIEDDSTLDRIASALAHQVRDRLDQSGMLRVRLVEGSVTLQPGSRRSVALEIRVPRGLPSGSRQLGTLAIQDTNLNFVVTPTPGGDRKVSHEDPYSE